MESQQVSNSFKLRIALSGLCNYRCIFCHNEGRGNEYRTQFLEVDDVRRICAGAYRAGLRSFTFTGGEPLSNPKSREIIAAIRQEFPDVVLKMTSNVVLLKDSEIGFLDKNIDRIRVNFQSTNEIDFRAIIGIDRL